MLNSRGIASKVKGLRDRLRVVDVDALPTRTYALALVGFAILSHHIWFNFGTVLFHADWLRWTDQAAQQAWSALGAWSGYFGFGGPRVQIGFTLHQSLWSAITSAGASFDTAVKLSLMIPIALAGFLAPFFFLKKVIGHNFTAFVAALFYGTTTYFLLRQGSQLQIAFIYALAPLLLLLLHNALRSNGYRHWVGFGLLYALALSYEVRIVYILTFVLILYALLFKPEALRTVALLKRVAITGVVIVAVSSFWLVPTVFGGTSSAIADITSRDLFGNELFDLPHAIALSVSSWTGSTPNESFVMQSIIPILWLVPLICLTPLIFRRRINSHGQKLTIFFLVIALLGIFLTKQVQAPIAEAYSWLYVNFPGFSLFREASKFYVLTALGYTGLLAVGIVTLKRRKPLFYVLAAVGIGVVAVANVMPLVTGNMQSLFVARSMPDEYKELNKFLLGDKTDFYRTLWVPLDSQWAYFDAAHPKVGLVNVLQKEWAAQNVSADSSNIQSQALKFFQSPSAQNLVSSGAIKYLIVPLRDEKNSDDFFRYYGNNRQSYIDTLDQLPWLKKLSVNSGSAAVYQNLSFKPTISTAVNVAHFSDAESLKELGRFKGEYLRQNYDYVLSSDNKGERGVTLTDLFQPLDAGDIGNGEIKRKFKVDGSRPTQLVVNEGARAAAYRVEGNNISMLGGNNASVAVDGRVITTNTESSTLGEIRIDTNKKYYILKDDTLLPVDVAKTGLTTLGSVKTGLSLISSNQNNLVKNSSFESGLWNEEVQDCDPYDDKPLISAQVEKNDTAHLKSALALSAIAHDACQTTNEFAINDKSTYALSFAYKVRNTDRIGYQIKFIGSAGTTMEKNLLDVPDGIWSTEQIPIRPPAGTRKISVSLISTPDTAAPKIATTYYDHVTFQELSTEIEVFSGLSSKYRAIEMPSGEHRIEYNSESVKAKNIIPGAWFERGLWSSKVSDCNSYDDAPDIKMQLSEDASDGDKSLQLSAKAHTACTGPVSVNVDENATYLLSFDVKSPNTKTSPYTLQFDDPNKTAIRGVAPTTKEWSTFKRQFTVPYGAKKVKIIVSALSPSSGGRYTVNRYDNFSLIQVPDIGGQFVLVGGRGAAGTAPKVSVTQPASVKKSIEVERAMAPFYLTSADSYNEGWRIRYGTSEGTSFLQTVSPFNHPKAVAENDHYKWNGFVNGWYIDPEKVCTEHESSCRKNGDGSYDMSLVAEYTPQRWYYVGLLLSVASLLLITVYLLAPSTVSHLRSIHRSRARKYIRQK